MTLNEFYEAGEIDDFVYAVKVMCRKKLNGRTVAGMEIDDVMQEVVIKTLDSMSSYKPEKAGVRTYVSCIMENYIRDLFRKAKKHLHLINAMELPDDSRYGELEDGRIGTRYADMPNNGFVYYNEGGDYRVGDSVWCFMQDIKVILSDREYSILRLHLEGFSSKEVAQKMGISAPRVSQIWQRVKQKCEEYLISG